MPEKKTVRMKASIVKPRTVEKAANTKESLDPEQTQFTIKGTIAPLYDPETLEVVVRESFILPQCIKSYRNNIAGFGIGVRYKDETEDPSPEAVAEFNRLEELITDLSIEKPTKELFEDIVDFREITGYCFAEIIPDGEGNPIEICPIDSKTMTLTSRDNEFTNYTVYRNGREIQGRKRFRRFLQQVNGQQIYFKEFGDPRTLHKTTGRYARVAETREGVLEEVLEDIPERDRANEVYHFKIGYGAYGSPRWEGTYLTALGSKSAEKLNVNYFSKGRHTPLMIVVQGGSLSDDSWTKLQEYIEGVEGEDGQYGWVVLETEAAEGATDFDNENKVNVTIEPLAEILQKDELFQDYFLNSRQKIQSSFLLPDLYVGYTRDYNVATARQASLKTEEQVFIPERESLSWHLNNILRNYRFQFVEAYFRSPSLENSDLQAELFGSVVNHLTPNQAAEEYYRAMNREFEATEELWGNVPLTVFPLLTETIERAIKIEKEGNPQDNIIGVLKEVKKVLLDKQKELA